ncbi:MAG: glycosyltransferase family 87 protein, partial [Chloroflexota bacterium]
MEEEQEAPQSMAFLRDPQRVAAILLLVISGAAIVVWILARGDLVGSDARAYWGGVRLWLGGGDPLDPPPPYLPYVYWPWSLPIFLPWAALPWETAWFVYRVLNIVLFAWSAAWAYRQRPLPTAVLVLAVTPALAATLDTGNITFLAAMGIWAAHFVSPKWGGLMWALAAALKWFPALLFLILPPRTRLWGVGWVALFAVLTLAVWPSASRQLELVINFPRPLRIDYFLLIWAAVPWLWAHPRWFE